MNTDDFKYFKNPPQSYWMASAPQTQYPSVDRHMKVDLAIIGGGIAGISCAYQLLKAGIKAVIIEADRIVQGTTGHTTAKITSQHELIYNKIKKQHGEEQARQYADANETAIREIRKIVEENKIHRVGAYRDEQGKLHIVNSTCTHMGCELNWNSAEKSWDCPCHGSRFTYEGEIIEGPAVSPLKKSSDVNTIEKLLKDKF